jgi:predicted phage tail protein
VLTWSAPTSDGGSPVTNYTIYRGTISGEETLLVTLGNVLTYTNTGLTNGQTYYYKVSAANSVGEGAKSNEASAIPMTVPSAPQGLLAIAGNAQVVLNWTAPANNGGSSITGYKVYRGTTSGELTLLMTLGVVVNYTDSSVTNGQTYYYKVSAVNSAGESAQAGEVTAMPVAPSNNNVDIMLILAIVIIIALVGITAAWLLNRRKK